jgi:hypothetical protein
LGLKLSATRHEHEELTDMAEFVFRMREKRKE